MLADWWIFQQAVQLILNGYSPYLQGHFFNPTWALLPWLPIAALPGNWPGVAWTIITLIGIAIALRRMGFTASRSILAIAAPFAAVSLVAGNVDWIVLLGATFPPMIGVWLVIIKPQIGLGVIGWWILKWYRRGEWHRVFWLIAPVTLVLMLQNAIVGPHPMPANSGFTPLAFVGWPIGLWLLVKTWRTERRDTALAAMPFLSPYLNITSFIAWLPLVMRQSRRVTILCSAAGWIALIVFWWLTLSAL